jgi:hypothetical protein
MNRLACAQTPRITRTVRRECATTLAASDELTSNFNFESQYGPIPLNGDGPREVFALSFVRNIMLRTLSLVAVLLASSGATWAQGGMQHTPAEERACRGDAHRFCREVLSDEFQVASCLQENRNRVSHACRTVLQGHGR